MIYALKCCKSSRSGTEKEQTGEGDEFRVLVCKVVVVMILNCEWAVLCTCKFARIVIKSINGDNENERFLLK